MATRYVYQSLQSPEHIRLLDLGDEDEYRLSWNPPLRIVSFPRNECPPYECVSYAWITNRRDIELELEDGRVIMITSSIETALPFLTNATRTGYLWIDQICIDQDNIPERNAQVAMMGDIYREAQRLLVWLSQRDRCSDLVLELADVLPERQVVSEDEYWTKSVEPDKRKIESFCESRSVKDLYHAALAQIFALPWVWQSSS